MSDPLAALVEAAQHLLETPMEDLTYGDFLPLTKALAAIPPGAVLVTEEALVRAIAGDNDPDEKDEWWTTPRTFAAAILAALREHP